MQRAVPALVQGPRVQDPRVQARPRVALPEAPSRARAPRRVLVLALVPVPVPVRAEQPSRLRAARSRRESVLDVCALRPGAPLSAGALVFCAAPTGLVRFPRSFGQA